MEKDTGGVLSETVFEMHPVGILSGRGITENFAIYYLQFAKNGDIIRYYNQIIGSWSTVISEENIEKTGCNVFMYKEDGYAYST